MPPSLIRTLCLLCAVAGCSSEQPEPHSAVGNSHAPALPRRASNGAAAGQTGSATGGSATDDGGSANNGAAAGAEEAPAQMTPQDCERSRFVLRPDVSNARDLGGVPLSPSGAVECGAFFRGPPLRLTPEGCSELTTLGVRTVLDLRMEQESSYAPESSCVTAKHVPAPLPVPYGLGPEDYLRDLNTDTSIALVFHTFGNPAAYPIYFHCTYGRDRTGVVGALLLLALGATRETVMAEYLLSEPNVGAYPNSLDAVLDEVARRGGAEKFLTELGISAEELAVLKSKIRMQ